MSKKLKIFLLSPYLPALNTTACARKIYDCISLLFQRGHLIYLFSFCSKEDSDRVHSVSSYCTQLYLEFIRDYSRYPINFISLRQKIDLLCREKDFDILQCEKAYMARYLPSNIKIPSVLIEHDILSFVFLERLKLENNFLNRLILSFRCLKKRFEEKDWYRKFDKIIVLSEPDRDRIRGRYGLENTEVIPLGINLNGYNRFPQSSKRLYDILFVGNFSHLPNVDAVLYFCQQILPLIKIRLPNIKFAIVGANLPDCIRKLAQRDKNIIVTGYLEDISKVYSESKIFVAPLRYGGGMRYKILEALTLRLPIVATSSGVRGIVPNGYIKIADTPRDFSEAVTTLLNSPEEREILGSKGRSVVESFYNWDKLLDKYEKIYYDLLR